VGSVDSGFLLQEASRREAARSIFKNFMLMLFKKNTRFDKAKLRENHVRSFAFKNKKAGEIPAFKKI
jgi:hypothetical protein